MAGEDFGAGIDVPPVQTATNVQPQPAPAPSTPISRALAEQLASAGLNVPEDWDDSTIADNLIAMQQRADKSAEYETRIRQFEEQQAQVLAQQTAPKPAPAETPSQAAARQRRYEKAVLDQAMMPFVVPDLSGSGFAPKDRMNPYHIQAAQAVNEAYQKRSKVSNDFVNDPYDTVAELTQDLLDAQNAKIEERFKAMEAKFTPVEQQMALSAQQQAEAAFVETNKAKLYDATGEFTPVGNAVNTLYSKGMPLEDALATAEAIMGQQTPVVPEKPKTISKVATPAPQRDNRFIAGVHPSRLQNVPDSGAPPTGRMNSFNDFYAKHPEARPGRRN